MTRVLCSMVVLAFIVACGESKQKETSGLPSDSKASTTQTTLQITNNTGKNIYGCYSEQNECNPQRTAWGVRYLVQEKFCTMVRGSSRTCYFPISTGKTVVFPGSSECMGGFLFGSGDTQCNVGSYLVFRVNGDVGKYGEVLQLFHPPKAGYGENVIITSDGGNPWSLSTKLCGDVPYTGLISTNAPSYSNVVGIVTQNLCACNTPQQSIALLRNNAGGTVTAKILSSVGLPSCPN